MAPWWLAEELNLHFSGGDKPKTEVDINDGDDLKSASL